MKVHLFQINIYFGSLLGDQTHFRAADTSSCRCQSAGSTIGLLWQRIGGFALGWPEGPGGSSNGGGLVEWAGDKPRCCRLVKLLVRFFLFNGLFHFFLWPATVSNGKTIFSLRSLFQHV